MDIHVAYTVDIQGTGAKQFSDQLLVGIGLLKQTKRECDHVFVHILYAHISGETVVKSLKFEDESFSVLWTKIKENDLKYMQKFTAQSPMSNIRTWSGIVYARLWIPRAYPNIQRMIYLDIDTMVRKSLHELYDYDLQGKKLGMVMGHTVEYGYNSGVMLIDCEKIRNTDNIWAELDDFMEKNARTFYLPDQTTINMFFKNDILKLPLKYNYPPKPSSSNVSPSDEDLNEAVIWHFYFPGPKQHRLDEYEKCNLVWNSYCQKFDI